MWRPTPRGAVRLAAVIAHVAGGAGVATIAILILFRYVKPLARIWRGDLSRMPAPGRVLAVTPRTYPSFLLCAGTTTAGFALSGIAVVLGGVTGASWPRHLLLAGLIMLPASVALVPLNWLVEATNRPRFLVPPPYRDQPGSINAARARRRRVRAGLPPTDHLVEIFEVRTTAGKGSEPYLVAICADDDCGWSAFADDDVLGRPEEDQVRAKAARHTTNVAREVQHRP